jgi:transcription antitermination protein NusB
MILNRRHLRVKVLQALYAAEQSENTDLNKGIKELEHSISKVYDLYLIYLTLIQELRHVAMLRIEEGKNKKLPTPEDLDPNLRLVNNPVLEQICANYMLKRESEIRKINWIGQQDLPRGIYAELKKSDLYGLYMNRPEVTYNQHRDFLADVFKEFIANSEDLLNWLDEKSIYWADDMDMVSGMVIRTIKNLKESDGPETKILDLYKDEKEDAPFTKTLYTRAIQNIETTDDIINRKAENWELERIAVMDRILMRMAITEAIEFAEIPVKVSLNEYIEISKFYSTPKSNSFINGILDRAFSELKQKGIIRKTGRGLQE